MLFCVKVTAFLNTTGIWCKYMYGQIPHALFNIRKDTEVWLKPISAKRFFYPKRKYFEASNSPEEIESVYWGYF